MRTVDSLPLVDVEAQHLDEVIERILETEFKDDEQRSACNESLRKCSEDDLDKLGPAVALLHRQVDTPGLELQILVRVTPPLRLRDASGEGIRFVWVLVSDRATHHHLDEALEFGHLMKHEKFREAALEAPDSPTLTSLYLQELDSEVHFQSETTEELRHTGRYCGALIADIKRRIPLYKSDFVDGLSSKSLGSSLFLFSPAWPRPSLSAAFSPC